MLTALWHRNHVLYNYNYCYLRLIQIIVQLLIDYCLNDIYLRVVPPEWIIEPKDVNVVRDDQAEVNCSASGHPKPTIKWKKGTSNNFKKVHNLRRGIKYI